MNEKDLIKLWNEKRSQIIMAQIAPALVLIGIFVSQYAAVREGEALVDDLAKISSKSALGKKIAESRGLLSLSAIAIVGSGVAIFALVVWAVLG